MEVQKRETEKYEQACPPLPNPFLYFHRCTGVGEAFEKSRKLQKTAVATAWTRPAWMIEGRERWGGTKGSIVLVQVVERTPETRRAVWAAEVGMGRNGLLKTATFVLASMETRLSFG